MSALPGLPKRDGQSIIERLPPELYMTLLRHMTAIEGVLLSLTCKSLWAQVTLQSTDVLHKVKRYSSLDKTLHFLRMLEKDNSCYILCTFCLRLHPRRRLERITLIHIKDIGHKRRPCSEELGVLQMKGLYEHRLVVYREAVDLLLRAATLGPEFGLHLDCMRESSEWEVYSAAHLNIRFRSSALAVPVPGSEQGLHLFIKATYTVELDLRRSLSAQIKGAEIGGCGHDREHETKCIVREIERTTADPVKKRTPILLRCKSCPTDLVIDIHYEDGQAFAEVCVTVHRDLGPRSDHTAPIWQRQTTPYLRSAEPFDRGTNYPFGNERLCDVWYEAWKLADAKEGELSMLEAPQLRKLESVVVGCV